MVPSFEYGFENNGDRNSATFLICSMSPSAKNSIERELYRQTADSDGASEQYVLEDAFLSLIKDIEKTGLSLSFDYSEITEELGPMFDFLHFASYLLPNTLYDIIRTNERIRDCLEHILNGSLGDDETLIQTYLSELGGLDDQDALVPELTPVVDRYYSTIMQTEIFTDYLRNLMDLVSLERLAPESDAATHQVFRDKARDLIGRFSDAVNLFENNDFYDQLCTIQNWFIKDTLAPSNFTEYNYLLTNTPTDLPEDLVENYERKWYHYKVSHIWCFDYFTLRNLEISPVYRAAIDCFLYTMSATEEAFAEAQKKLPTQSIESVIPSLYKETIHG